ncbi:MAG: hypothetical protein HXS49_12095 [Theionarchaea archaeon]|nr:hypothetical protein [Theionarchaea archaeon]MBU6999386.1 hypothetical protein [Theionarchaea archaeon]MBU7035925.1 hypothetical protein [Theionarchaea archaeon]MBU7041575.1 hypothetical protein [Theionarchaea archaeon]
MDFATTMIDISIVTVLLIVGAIVRAKVRVLQRFVIPVSVIAGVIGLVLGHNVLGVLPTSQEYADYAAALINVVFAGVFIGRTIPSFKKLGETAGAQTLYAVFNNFGQIVVGMLVVVLFAAAGMALHPTFGMQLILGYQGGVGVPSAFAPMYEGLGWSSEAASAVGETCAITGLVLSILVGFIILNIGVAKNLTQKKFHEKGEKLVSNTFVPPGERKSIGSQITNPEAVSSIGFSFGFMALAILGGKVVQTVLVSTFPQLRYIPLFPFVLVGGIVVQIFLQKTNLDTYVDRGTVSALSSVALDVLIVTALISIKPSLVVVYALPLLVMLVLGTVFNLWQMTWLAPRVLPGAWFEKALSEWGQGTGSTASAMLLLRSADPELETGAAEAFGLKMFFTSPTMVPMLMIISPIVANKGPLFVLGAYFVGMIVVLAVLRAVSWIKRPDVSWR